jgi:hypothetical protein
MNAVDTIVADLSAYRAKQDHLLLVAQDNQANKGYWLAERSRQIEADPDWKGDLLCYIEENYPHMLHAAILTVEESTAANWVSARLELKRLFILAARMQAEKEWEEWTNAGELH